MFNQTKFTSLCNDLVAAELDLAGKTKTAYDAQIAAAAAQSDLTQAQKANQGAVMAIKTYADSLDADGNEPPPAALPPSPPADALPPSGGADPLGGTGTNPGTNAGAAA